MSTARNTYMQSATPGKHHRHACSRCIHAGIVHCWLYSYTQSFSYVYSYGTPIRVWDSTMSHKRIGYPIRVWDVPYAYGPIYAYGEEQSQKTQLSFRASLISIDADAAEISAWRSNRQTDRQLFSFIYSRHVMMFAIKQANVLMCSIAKSVTYSKRTLLKQRYEKHTKKYGMHTIFLT